MGHHLVQGQFARRHQLDGPLVILLLVHQRADQAEFAVLHQAQIDHRLLPKHAHHHDGAALARIVTAWVIVACTPTHSRIRSALSGPNVQDSLAQVFCCGLTTGRCRTGARFIQLVFADVGDHHA